ncbi:MAG: hypothetical protein ACNA71_08990 [Kiritimatiellia bacterium]
MRKEVRFGVLAMVVVICCSYSLAWGQMLPSHGASAAGRTPVLIAGHVPAQTGYVFTNDLGLALVYGPSPRENLFKEKLGFAVHATFPMHPQFGLRLSTGFERFAAKRPGVDGEVIPLGLSFLLGFPGADRIPVGLELGLQYQFVDYEDARGDFDNAFGGVVGLLYEPRLADSVSFGFGVRYGFDISQSENDAGEELSLEGFDVRLSVRFSL